MQGKVCLVTGAASGLGAATARGLAQRGATVVLVDRDAEKGALLAEELRQAGDAAAVEFLRADLSAQAEIRALVEDFKRRYTRLDVLVNNAGAMFPERRESVDGIEMTLALNFLGYFLLTHLLLETLKASAPARVVNVSSRSHARAQINFEDLQFRAGYDGLPVYAHSKLAIVLFTYELARRLEGTGVTANALHPGVVATNFGTQQGGRTGMLIKLFRFAFLSPEAGAKTSLYLASSPEVAGVSGKYFVKCKAVPSAPASYDAATAARLWAAALALTEERDHVIT
ncbi:MAG: SDR family oxidoreductase [Anaerolineae bacterium]|jgi:NAD(P)-dependent dehydrogenase (short-subunit alcohol dehydrogenase family)|nr:SDR family oxidoreductase [Anaerolineae bacterium]